MSAIPSSSKAAVVREFGAPVGIEEVRIPKEIEPGAILTRIGSVLGLRNGRSLVAGFAGHKD